MVGFPLLLCLISVSHQVVERFAAVRAKRLAHRDWRLKWMGNHRMRVNRSKVPMADNGVVS